MADIRRAGPDDEEPPLLLVREFYARDRHEYSEERVLRGLRPLLAGDDEGRVFLAALDGVPYGYVVVTWSWSLEAGGRDALLDEMYVRRREQGIGSELLTAAIAAASDAGAASMFLETESPNIRVRGFYRRHGFVRQDSIWMSRPL